MSDNPTTHTPGPWAIGYDPDDDERPLEILAMNRDFRVAFPASDGNLADSFLIAAAPDLLDALKMLVETFEARPDILRLCGPHERMGLAAACHASIERMV
jgi:hypothetical protein